MSGKYKPDVADIIRRYLRLRRLADYTPARTDPKEKGRIKAFRLKQMIEIERRHPYLKRLGDQLYPRKIGKVSSPASTEANPATEAGTVSKGQAEQGKKEGSR